MIFELDDKCWNFVMDGLDCLSRESQKQAKEYGDKSLTEKSEEVRSLIQTLELFGQEKIGGKVEGFRFRATIKGKPCTLEIRMA